MSRVLDILNQQLSEILKEYGISESQFHVLCILGQVDPEVISCGSLGSRLISRDPDITRLLDRLENMGLVLRQRAPADRRVVLVGILEPGRELLRRLDEPLAGLHARQAQLVGEEKMESLSRELEEVRLRLEENPGRPGRNAAV